MNHRRMNSLPNVFAKVFAKDVFLDFEEIGKVFLSRSIVVVSPMMFSTCCTIIHIPNTRNRTVTAKE